MILSLPCGFCHLALDLFLRPWNCLHWYIWQKWFATGSSIFPVRIFEKLSSMPWYKVSPVCPTYIFLLHFVQKLQYITPTLLQRWNGINFFPGIRLHESHCYIIASRCYVCMYCFYSVINFHWWKLCKQQKRMEYGIRVFICKIIEETLFIYIYIYIIHLAKCHSCKEKITRSDDMKCFVI